MTRARKRSRWGRVRYRPYLVPFLSVIWAGLVLAWSAGMLAGMQASLSDMAVAAGNGPAWSWVGLVRALIGHLAWLPAPAAILAGAWWSGGFLLSWIGPAGRGPLRVALRPVMGFGLLASFHHGLGLAGLFFVPVLASAGAVVAAAGLVSAVRFRPWRAFPGTSSPKGNWPLVAACLLSVSMMWLLARLPDAGTDARIYHFAAPEHYLVFHKIVPQPSLFTFHVPRAFEMNVVTPWALGGVSAAKMLGASVAMVLSILVYLLALELGGMGWLAMAFILGTGILTGMGQGKNDPLMGACLTAGILCILRAGRERRRVPWLVAGAWLLGSAVGVKFNAGFVVGGVILALFILPWKGVHFRAWLLAGVALLFPVLEWFGESALFLGNPFHPFLSGLFARLSWSPFYRDGLSQVVIAYSPAEARQAGDVIGGLWRILGDPAVGFPAMFFALPYALGAPRSRRMVFAVVAGLLAYVAWAATERVPRLAFGLVPLAAALAASAPVLRVLRPRALARANAAVGGLVVLSMVSTALSLVPLGGWLVLAGQKESSVYLAERYGPWNSVREWVNSHVPSRSRVLFTGEDHRLWFRPPVIGYFDVMEPLPWKFSRESATPARMRIKMRQVGAGFLLHNYLSSAFRHLVWWPGPGWDDRQLKVYESFMRLYARPVYTSPRVDIENGGYFVFRFQSRPRDDAGPALMLPCTEGRWLLSYSLMRGGEYGESWKAAGRDMAPMMEVLQVRFVMATLAARRGKWRDALGLIEPAVRGGLVDNGSWNYYGTLLVRAGRMDEAVRAYSRSALLQGDEASLAMLGRALRDRASRRLASGDKAGAARDREVSGYLPVRK